jgi:hypothetical protein
MVGTSKDWGIPLMILGSVIIIFGIKNLVFLIQTPEYKGFKINEDYSLRDSRQTVTGLNNVQMAQRIEDLKADF